MNLHPDLLETLAGLGVTEAELVLLRGRMLSVVSSLEARLNSLDTQLESLSALRKETAEELMRATVTVGKLLANE